MIDRYICQGLLRNPFAVSLDDHDPADVFVDRSLPDPPPAMSRTFVQVIGDKGAGKSTQLQSWRRRAPGPYHYVPARPYYQRWVRPPVAGLVYGDEIDRLPAPLRWRWMRSLASMGSTLIVGTHVDLAPIATRAGFHVITHRFGSADLDTVAAVLHAKVRAVSTGRSPSFRLTDADIVDIYDHCGGSLRTAEVLAHELVARRIHAGDGLVPSSSVHQTQA